MDIDEARALMNRTLQDWEEARDMQLESDRRLKASNLILQGLFTGFPGLREEMTIQTAGETSDDYHQDDDTPRGAEAVLRVLQVNENASFSVAQMVAALESRGWLPESEGGDPANAVRTALERVLNRNPGVKKLRKAGAVAYRYNEPEPEPGGESLDSILSGGPHPETIAEKAKADALLDIAAEGREIAEGGAD